MSNYSYFFISFISRLCSYKTSYFSFAVASTSYLDRCLLLWVLSFFKSFGIGFNCSFVWGHSMLWNLGLPNWLNSQSLVLFIFWDLFISMGTCKILYLCIFVELGFWGKESKIFGLFKLSSFLYFSDIKSSPIFIDILLPRFDCIEFYCIPK